MPYITPEERDKIDPLLEQLLKSNLLNGPGELNYIISRIAYKYIQDLGCCYTTLNETIGVLECAKLELYRIICAPYEDKKRTINGTISELDKESGG